MTRRKSSGHRDRRESRRGSRNSKDKRKKSSLTDPSWTGRIYGSAPQHEDLDLDFNEDLDGGNIIGGEQDIMQVLDLLSNQRSLRLTKGQREALQDTSLKTFDKAFSHWNAAISEEYEKTQERDEDRIADFGQNIRLTRIMGGRRRCSRTTFAIAFHVVVLANLIQSIWESYGTLVESAKLDLMYLENSFQCLRIPVNQSSVSHFINIFHSFTCVAVLHAKSRKTAKLCWAFLVGCVLHSGYTLYEELFAHRFVYDSYKRGFTHYGDIMIVLHFIWQILGIIVIVLRYYDLTENIQARADDFAKLTYEGRQLNDKIIFKNVSSFIQRKYVLRSCCSLQIYTTVQKIQAEKRNNKGVVDEKFFNDVVRSAVVELKEVEGFPGMDMLRELKRRQYQSANNTDDFVNADFGGNQTEGMMMGEPDNISMTSIVIDEPVEDVETKQKDTDIKKNAGSKKKKPLNLKKKKKKNEQD